MDPKHKRPEQGSVRETTNVNVVDERNTENDQTSAKEDTIKIQFNILDNTTSINDDKGYDCALSIFTSDSDSVRIYNSHSNFHKESQQAVVREDITSNIIKERSIKENVLSNRKR